MGTRSSNRWLALPGVFLVAVLGLALIKLSGGAPTELRPPGTKPAIQDAALTSVEAPAAELPEDGESARPALSGSRPVSSAATPAPDAPSARRTAPPPQSVRASSPSGGPSLSLAGVPMAPMGERPSRSAFEGVPGYSPPSDPEAEATLTGRREAPHIDREFTEGASSSDELARQILDALRAKDKRALRNLQISSDEFGEILWPEFPASRPITRLKAADAWFFLNADCVKGINAAVDDFGGANLIFDRVAFDIGRAPYRNFTLYEGVRILAHDANGSPEEISFAQTFAERDGVWKVYSYRD